MDSNTRWEFVKKCWSLAEKVCRVDDVFVEIPKTIQQEGSCSVFGGGRKVGEISYYVAAQGDYPHISVSLNNTKEVVYLPRFASMEFKTVRIGGEISSSIMQRYANRASDKVAALIVGHSSGLGSEGLTDQGVDEWLRNHGFEQCDSQKVCASIESMGFQVKMASKKLFEEMEKIRINNPLSMEHNEGGRIMDYKKLKDGYVYLVLVDGSDSPIWFPETQLSKNKVGELDYRFEGTPQQ